METDIPEHGKDGLVHLQSSRSVDETLRRLEALLKDKGIKLFTVVDHSGEAAQAGLKMRPTKLMIFGNPKAGTPAMQASPTLAIDLPLKALLWEDAQGRVWLTYNDPEYLQTRHDVPGDLMTAIAGAKDLLMKATQQIDPTRS